MKEKLVYYSDELNDEFSTAKIEPRKIDENYKYIHKNVIWNACAFLLQNVLSIPIKYLYSKIKFRTKIIGKEKLKPYKYFFDRILLFYGRLAFIKPLEKGYKHICVPIRRVSKKGEEVRNESYICNRWKTILCF